jgi:hypothetical protein
MYYSKINMVNMLLAFIIMGCNKQTSFHQDIKPIIHKNCAVCHHNKGSGPFNLLTYKDVSKRANMILEVVETKYMPPWPADPSYREFLNQKVLHKEEIMLIKKWIKDGLQIGIKDDLEFKPPIKLDTQADMIVNMDKSYVTNGLNRDEFLMMKFPLILEKDTFIKYIEFIPGNNQIVHHINAHLITYESHQKENIFNNPRYVNTEQFSDEESFKKLDILNDDGTYPTLTPSVSNYLPGSESFQYPKGIGGFKAKKKNIILVNDFHYGPTNEPFKDSSYFKIYFDSIAPVRPIQEIQLGTFGISDIEPPLIIPANEIKKFKTSAIITRDISMLTINPHMHLLGKSFKAYAINLYNDTIPLIKIDDWNFRWQYFYTFKNPLKITGGSEIVVEATYDNTIKNPDNPFNPPRLISERVGFNGQGSMRTTDEMLQFIINYLPYQKGDENINLNI